MAEPGFKPRQCVLVITAESVLVTIRLPWTVPVKGQLLLFRNLNFLLMVPLSFGHTLIYLMVPFGFPKQESPFLPFSKSSNCISLASRRKQPVVCRNQYGEWGALMHSVCPFPWYKNSRHGQVQATNLMSLNMELRRKSALKSHNKTPAHPCQANQWCGNRDESGTTQEQASSWSSGLGTVLLPPHMPFLVFTSSRFPEATLPPLGDPALATWRGCISWQLRCDSSPAVINLLVRAVFPPRCSSPISSRLPPGWNLNFRACRKRLAPIWALPFLLIDPPESMCK